MNTFILIVGTLFTFFGAIAIGAVLYVLFTVIVRGKPVTFAYWKTMDEDPSPEEANALTQVCNVLKDYSSKRKKGEEESNPEEVTAALDIVCDILETSLSKL